MRVFTARLVLGVLLLAVVGALADTAQAGPFRNRRAAMYGGGYGGGCGCGDGGYVGYGGGMYSGGMVSYGQPVYSAPLAYGQTMYYPGTTYGYGGGMYYPSTAYGYGRTMYYPGTTYGYGQPMYYGTPGVYQAGYTPALGTGLVPAGGVPGSMPGRATEGSSVKITDTAFEPKELTISPNTTVRWTNNGNHLHTVTSSKGDWDSGDIQVGREFVATFTKAGTFEYYCKHHPEMKATIIVK